MNYRGIIINCFISFMALSLLAQPCFASLTRFKGWRLSFSEKLFALGCVGIACSKIAEHFEKNAATKRIQQEKKVAQQELLQKQKLIEIETQRQIKKRIALMSPEQRKKWEKQVKVIAFLREFIPKQVDKTIKTFIQRNKNPAEVFSKPHRNQIWSYLKYLNPGRDV